MIRILTAGESHGQALVGIVEGIPAGLGISAEYINFHLRRRQMGYGRGGRMRIESDKVEIISGVRFGKTIGSPIALIVRNKDWENWKEKMSVEFLGDQPISVRTPKTVDLKVILTGSGVKEAQDNTMKSATLENGMEILVPQFIKEGEIIRVDVETMKYLERVVQKKG